jgi:hypothetical protein
MYLKFILSKNIVVFIKVLNKNPKNSKYPVILIKIELRA